MHETTTNIFGFFAFIELCCVHKSFNCSEINMIFTKKKLQVKFRKIPRANYQSYQVSMYILMMAEYRLYNTEDKNRLLRFSSVGLILK